MLLRTLGCRYLFELFLFSADLYSVWGLLDHMAVPFLVFWGASILFSIVALNVRLETRICILTRFPGRFSHTVCCEQCRSTARRLFLLALKAEVVSVDGSSKSHSLYVVLNGLRAKAPNCSGLFSASSREHLEVYLGSAGVFGWQLAGCYWNPGGVGQGHC